MANFRLETRTRSGAYLATLRYSNLQGEMYKGNKWSAIRWDMSLEDTRELTYNELYPGKTEVWMFRDDVLKFAGPIWDANISTKEAKFSCRAEGLASYFDRRRIEAGWDSSLPLGQQAWNIVAASQALTDGNLFITQGTSVSGGAPSARIKFAASELKMVSDALADLSEGDNGFDWEVTPNRVFNVYYPRLSGRANVRLEFGGNIRSYAVDINGKYAANNVVVQGADDSLSAAVVDTAKRAEYGLRHYVGSNTGLKSRAQLDAYATQLLSLRRDTRIIPQLSVAAEGVNPFNGDIDYGQVARTVINDGWVQYDIDMRCSGYQFTVDKHGIETFVLYLNDLREVD